MLDSFVAIVVTSLWNATRLGARFSWLYLLSAVVIALVFYRGNTTSDTASAPWSLRRAVAAAFPRKVFLHPSALLDYRYFAVNFVLQVGAFGPLLLGSAVIADGVVGLIEPLLGPVSAIGSSPGLTMRALYGLLLLLALDAGLFLAHWLSHRFPVLWEFHKVHHSAQVLTPITVLRMHPVDLIVNSAVVSVLMGIVNGVFLYAYASPITQLWMFGSNAAVFVFFLAGYHLRHSHVWVMFPRGIRDVISSPALHLIHHSSDQRHYDCNFGRMFVIWDRLANSLYQPTEREDITFGLGDEDILYDSVTKLYFTPFVRAARLFAPSTEKTGDLDRQETRLER